MAHVTTFRLKAQAGKGDSVLGMFDRWGQEQKSRATGYEMSAIIRSNENPDDLMAVVRFDTTANYDANSGRPEQGAWFQELRALLAGDPEWFDGTVALEDRA